MDKTQYLPFWKTTKVIEESLILTEKDGIISGNLIFEPLFIEEIKNYDRTKIFDRGSYYFRDKTIYADNNSKMPYMTEPMLEGKVGAEEYGFSVMDGLVFTEGKGIVMHQVLVTYHYNPLKESWPVCPIYKGGVLENFYAKLKSGKQTGIILYGDSIAAGCHASSVINYPPYLPTWGESIAKLTEKAFNTEIKFDNISVGGYTSRQGREGIDGKPETEFNQYDLAIIAFGMNDGSWKIPAEEYKTNIQYIIDKIRSVNSACDIVIISTILANPLCNQDKELTSSYVFKDIELCRDNQRCINVDMTSFSKELYLHKNGIDVFANNINHPTDFYVRCYVMNIMESLFEDWY